MFTCAYSLLLLEEWKCSKWRSERTQPVRTRVTRAEYQVNQAL